MSCSFLLRRVHHHVDFIIIPGDGGNRIIDASTIEIPVCPNCDEPLYDTDQCVYCGQEIDQDDERLQKWLEPPEVKTMVCFECGGTMKYIESKITGHKHGKCRDCGLTFME